MEQIIRVYDVYADDYTVGADIYTGTSQAQAVKAARKYSPNFGVEISRDNGRDILCAWQAAAPFVEREPMRWSR